MSALAKERVRAKGQGAKKKAKARRGLATIAGEQGHFARECPAPKGKRVRATIGCQEIRKASAKAQTNLVEKEVCPS